MDKKIKWQIVNFDKVSSTNDIAQEYSRKKAGQYLIIKAVSQTQGRGRRGREWFSPQGNLYFSVLLEFNLKDLGALVIISSLSLWQAIHQIAPNTNLKIKWPNDILLNNAKISGILLEKGYGKYFIIGIGVNINQSPKLQNQIYPATSLQENRIIVSTDELLNIFLQKFTKNLQKYTQSGITSLQKEWLNNAKGLGNTIIVQQEKMSVQGKFIGIEETGALLLQTVDKIEKILIGDVFYIEKEK